MTREARCTRRKLKVVTDVSQANSYMWGRNLQAEKTACLGDGRRNRDGQRKRQADAQVSRELRGALFQLSWPIHRPWPGNSWSLGTPEVLIPVSET